MARILKKGDLSEFLAYLAEQIGEPYIWGGQHTKLTPENYVSVINRKETSAANKAAARAYCEKAFSAGSSVLYGYDCSGLGAYFLYDLHRIISSDTTANGLLEMCNRADEPKRGFWVFKTDSGGKATHIGYMVSDTEVVEARGRAYGVVRREYKKSDWNVIGVPKVFDFDDPAPAPKTAQYVSVKGSVRVREGNGTGYRAIATAHKGDLLPYYGQADKDPYWYEVDYKGQRGYISSNSKYTGLVWKATKS